MAVGFGTSTSGEPPGEGRLSLLSTLLSTCMASLFSCELRGSKASLLGTGVMVEEGRFEKDNALDFVVVSFRQSLDGVGREA